MIYSSYLGSKKCNNVICTQGEPGPRGIQGPVGPTGPSGNNLNSFTIISSEAVYINNSIIWNIEIPYIYGKQFTFNFYTIGSNVLSYTPAPSSYLTSTDTYIFGTGQAVYQPYQAIINNVTVTKYGYIPSIISKIGTNSNSNFLFEGTIDNVNNTIIYQFIYYNNNTNFQNSTIKLIGTKC